MSAKDALNPIKSVQTAIDIIDVLLAKETVGVTELANELGTSKATAHHHLSTLRQNGYIIKHGQRYKLGLRFIEVAHTVQNRNEIYHLVREEIDRLAKESGELALFTVEEQNQGVCLYKSHGENAIQTELHVGYRSNLHHTAVGKAILAHKPEDEIDELLQEVELNSLTENTITDENVLRKELAEIRKTGFSYNYEETITGLIGIGSPIRCQEGGVYGAISIIGPSSRLTNERLEEIKHMLYHSVNVIEINATSL